MHVNRSKWIALSSIAIVDARKSQFRFNGALLFHAAFVVTVRIGMRLYSRSGISVSQKVCSMDIISCRLLTELQSSNCKFYMVIIF